MEYVEATLNQNKKYCDDANNIKDKQYFGELLEIITCKMDNKKNGPVDILDVGCATGDFMAFLRHRMGSMARLTGVDIFPELLEKAYAKVSDGACIEASVWNLPHSLEKAFDAVIASGVLTLFRLEQLPTFFANIRNCLRDDGFAIVFSPFNKYGVDLHENHRVRNAGGGGNLMGNWL